MAAWRVKAALSESFFQLLGNYCYVVVWWASLQYQIQFNLDLSYTRLKEEW